jgi:hypothetical protein
MIDTRRRLKLPSGTSYTSPVVRKNSCSCRHHAIFVM